MNEMSGLPELFAAGESETVELKTLFRDPSALARMIASFANTEGGTIVVGVREPTTILGIDEARFRRQYDAACELLEPRPSNLTIAFPVVGNGLKIAIVKVAKSSTLILAQGGAYVRQGTSMRPMAWPSMLTRVPSPGGAATSETLAKAVEKLSGQLENAGVEQEKLMSALDKASDPGVRRTERFYGFCFGILASLVAAALWLGLTKIVPALR
ncbi:ATP-binding protein [Caballeronia sp. J97]|uniref:AlbA family DNA-binding domain-containing protein n=1 Tax=Caballeronia sp. J97 TaxID=2805429 RepID=UPI002AAF16D8|nr:ATP-binding protein [Caballeronia sp. J97]